MWQRRGVSHNEMINYMNQSIMNRVVKLGESAACVWFGRGIRDAERHETDVGLRFCVCVTITKRYARTERDKRSLITSVVTMKALVMHRPFDLELDKLSRTNGRAMTVKIVRGVDRSAHTSTPFVWLFCQSCDMRGGVKQRSVFVALHTLRDQYHMLRCLLRVFSLLWTCWHSLAIGWSINQSDWHRQLLWKL